MNRSLTWMSGLAATAVLSAGALAQSTAPAPAGATGATPAASMSAKPAPDWTAATAASASRMPDVIFVPTPADVVEAMLEVAKVGPDDVLYDLGSGNGIIPVTAAKKYGTRGKGFDIDPKRIQEARANAESNGVSDKVEFVQADLFEQDLSGATVISLYLLNSLNLKLRPTLLALKPGTRIVSHAFDMGDWKPDQTVNVDGRMVYFWTVPEPKK